MDQDKKPQQEKQGQAQHQPGQTQTTAGTTQPITPHQVAPGEQEPKHGQGQVAGSETNKDAKKDEKGHTSETAKDEKAKDTKGGSQTY